MITTIISRLMISIGSSCVQIDNTPSVPEKAYYFYAHGANASWNELTNWWTSPDGTGENPALIPWVQGLYDYNLYFGNGIEYPVIESHIGETYIITGNCNIDNIQISYSGNIVSGNFSGNSLKNSGIIYGGNFSGSDFTNFFTIEGGTFGAATNISNQGTINGGTFNGEVTNQATGTVNDGIFNADNFYNVHIVNSGTFNGYFFKNYGYIYNGTFTGDAFNNFATIYDGLFTGNGFVNSGTIASGVFNQSYITNSGSISNGTFLGSTGSVFINDGGYISEGSFSNETFHHNNGTISAGIFYNTLFVNYSFLIGGTWAGVTFINYGPDPTGGSWPVTPPPTTPPPTTPPPSSTTTTTIFPTTTTTAPTTTPPPVVNDAYQINGDFNGQYSIAYTDTAGVTQTYSGECGSDSCDAGILCVLSGHMPVANIGTATYISNC